MNDVFTPTRAEIAYYQGLLATMHDAERRGTAADTRLLGELSARFEGKMTELYPILTLPQC